MASSASATPGAPPARPTTFGTLPDGRAVELHTLVNARGTTVRVLSLGGIIQGLQTRDRHGALADVTLGYDALEDYLGDPRYFGALVGRYANRIARGRFTLDGVEHVLSTNDGPNHLHGGPRGFHSAVWRVEPFARIGETGLVLSHDSPDGDEGYPGAVAARVTYTLGDDDALSIDYRAESTAATPVSLTQHAYFNLAGHAAGDVLDHELTIAASRYTPVDATLIPTGELRPVEGTPFDLRRAVRLGTRLNSSVIAADPQLGLAQGYDHNFALDGQRDAGVRPSLSARLHDPRSGRVLEIDTSEPGVQLYTGNGLAGGRAGKGGHAYPQYGGLALETQRFPDSPNQPTFPSSIVRPGAPWTSTTVWRFSVEGGPRDS